MGFPEGEILAIAIVSQNRLTTIKNHENLSKFQKSVLESNFKKLSLGS